MIIWFKLFCVLFIGSRALGGFISNVRSDKSNNEFTASIILFMLQVFIIVGILIWL